MRWVYPDSYCYANDSPFGCYADDSRFGGASARNDACFISCTNPDPHTCERSDPRDYPHSDGRADDYSYLYRDAHASTARGLLFGQSGLR